MFGPDPRLSFSSQPTRMFCFVFLEKIDHLPGVDGAISSAERVALGIFQSVQDGLVFGAEVHAEHLVNLVDHFGSGGVFRSSFGVFASSSLDAAQFLF